MRILALSVQYLSIGHLFFFRSSLSLGYACERAGSYDQNWKFMVVNTYLILWKQHTIGVRILCMNGILQYTVHTEQSNARIYIN